MNEQDIEAKILQEVKEINEILDQAEKRIAAEEALKITERLLELTAKVKERFKNDSTT